MDEKLDSVIVKARRMMGRHEFKDCEKMVRQAMGSHPDNAIPYNLMGILYEKQGDHIRAMKFFRAAWVFDPSYRPALMNLERFGSLFSDKTFIFDESDDAPDCGRPDGTPMGSRTRERR